MGKFIPEEVIEEVRSASDIVGVVSDYVGLKQKGNRFWGLCPFHSEDTPSFSVYPEKEIFYCFGCNTGGNVFKFIMLKEQMNFPEAVRLLASRGGISLPETEVLSPEQQKRERAYQANTLAMKYYHYVLMNKDTGAQAKEYLKGRTLSQETIIAFNLGYAPAGWDSLTKFLLQRGYKQDELIQWGLALEGRNNKIYDRFRNRVIFPIINNRNKVVGFGGRVMDDSLPKYLNSAESEIFHKASNLYGINLAFSSIRQKGQVIFVEGYLDVISAHQAGITNVVAALGTALTKEHAQAVLRYADEVVLAFDADPAGQKATLRGMDILQESGCRVKVLPIPEGKDPDEFINKNGAEAFCRLVDEKSLSLISFKMNAIKNKYNLSTTGGKLKVLGEVLPNLNRVKNQVELEEYLSVIGTELNLSWDSVRSELQRYRQEEIKKYPARDKNVKKRYNTFNNGEMSVSSQRVTSVHSDVHAAIAQAEETLIRFIVEKPAYLDQVINKLGHDAFQVKAHQKLLEWLIQLYNANRQYDVSLITGRIDDEDLSNLLAKILVSELPIEQPQLIFNDCLNTLWQARVKQRKESLLKDMGEAEKRGDLAKVNQLLQEIKQMM